MKFVSFCMEQSFYDTQFSFSVPSRASAFLISGMLLSGMLMTATARADEATKGKIIVEQNCARCHEIGATGDNVSKSGPPFRKLASRYPLENLQEALAEGITVGHKGQDMPEFEFAPEAIDQIIAYLKSISEKK